MCADGVEDSLGELPVYLLLFSPFRTRRHQYRPQPWDADAGRWGERDGREQFGPHDEGQQSDGLLAVEPAVQPQFAPRMLVDDAERCGSVCPLEAAGRQRVAPFVEREGPYLQELTICGAGVMYCAVVAARSSEYDDTPNGSGRSDSFLPISCDEQ